jgi:hypothetical protein
MKALASPPGTDGPRCVAMAGKTHSAPFGITYPSMCRSRPLWLRFQPASGIDGHSLPSRSARRRKHMISACAPNKRPLRASCMLCQFGTYTGGHHATHRMPSLMAASKYLSERRWSGVQCVLSGFAASSSVRRLSSTLGFL